MKRLRAYTLYIIILLMMLPCMAVAREWSADDIPMVHLRDSTRYLCDPEELVSPEARDSADHYLSLLEHQCGVQNVFIVVSNVKDADCFRMSQDVGNKYGVGDKKNRRGLVVVIAVDDRKYFIAPGSGLEGELTDVDCDDIGRNLIAGNMKEDNLDAAVWHTAKGIYNKLKTGETGYSSVDGGLEAEDVGWILFLLVILFGGTIYRLFYWIAMQFGLVKPSKKVRKQYNDHLFEYIFLSDLLSSGGSGGHSGGFGGGGFGGGSFGGGGFSGGGAGGGW